MASSDDHVCRFYFAAPSEVAPPEGGGDLRVALWRPSLRRPWPRRMFTPPLAVWWIFHELHVFRNRRYGVLTVYDGDKPIHRSVVTPGWFRFPFMAVDDLQIGDTWTDPDYRGRGIASEAIRKVAALERTTCGRLWYLTEEANLASIRAAEKAGLSRYRIGHRTRRLGLRLLGAFVPTRESPG